MTEGTHPFPEGGILLVDDQPANIQVLHAALKGLAPVRFATSGAQALTLVAEQAPAVVLTDLTMPEMDGATLARRLRQETGLTTSAVVLVSGTLDEAGLAPALANGVDDYWVRPLPPVLLRHRVLLLAELVTARRSGLPPRESPSLPPRPRRGGRQRVLVIEDGEINRMILMQALHRAGHVVTMAVSAEEGLERLAEQSFDAVLMDIHLPGIDGLEALRRLRLAEPDPDRRPLVVAVTGDVAPDSVTDYREAGFDAVVRKPIDPDLLQRALTGDTVLPEEDDAAATPLTEPEPDLLVDHQRVAALRRTYPPARLRALYMLFRRETQSHMTTLKDALAREDSATLSESAHRLTSALGHFACSRMASVSDRLAHGHNLPLEEQRQLVERLVLLLPDTLSALRGALDLATPPQDPPPATE